MALLLANRPLERHAGRRMLLAVAVFGLATIVFGLSSNLYLSLACLAVLGAADMISVYVRQTLVQLETPDAMRGRVAAVNAVFIGASNELGEFESGVLAAAVGAVPAVVLGASAPRGRRLVGPLVSFFARPRPARTLTVGQHGRDWPFPTHALSASHLHAQPRAEEAMAETVRDLLQPHRADAAAILAPERPILTFGGLRELADATVGKLNGLGIGRGDRVAIVLPNGPEMATSFVTVACAATTAPLTPPIGRRSSTSTSPTCAPRR